MININGARPSAAPKQTVRGWHDLRTTLDWAFDGEVETQFLRRPFVPRGTTAWLIRRGRVTLDQADSPPVRVREGQWVILGERATRQAFVRNTHLLSIRFEARWLSGHPLYTHETARVLRADDHPNLNTMGTALAASVSAAFGPQHTQLPTVAGTAGDYFGLRARFDDWLAAYAAVMDASGVPTHVPASGDPRVSAALALIEAVPLSPLPTARQIASMVGVSTSQLHRLVGQQVRTTFRALLDARRREQAVFALRFTHAPIKAMAMQLGFSSVQHFTFWCTRHLGTTPAAFRQQGVTD